ncbi:HU family DNA-binding protein [Patescibacteria group bacterium]|nr:HU family DNA-binding protein [Patescibacteria group bacterium]
MHLNKAALAEAVAKKAGASKKEAEDMVDAFVSIVISTLKDGGSVGIAGFGQFSAKTRAGRVGVNPQNPTEKIDIPPVTVPKFKAGLALKKALKEDRSVSAPKSEPAITENAPEASPAEPALEDTREETTQM